ncbi:hypothetical protein [Streptococcus suis]|uniref:hypothetical protein n=1 Tax=Streptococcus suis TaxID=1307 RepID=UPI000ABDB8A7|nr:hypothetical protein [Streptococcus suis]NQI09807.1 hypothetical protein [Streptococcus suis]NQR88145.1 hypothetical protein [Streptococcus suis]HEM4110761.1 hypothetical protein [Streptococcus suis]HEM5125735.1 hypothetical protein [Streptococcus suis]HEM5693135.1 hypothetical protein [Streptococcus suis]
MAGPDFILACCPKFAKKDWLASVGFSRKVVLPAPQDWLASLFYQGFDPLVNLLST